MPSRTPHDRASTLRVAGASLVAGTALACAYVLHAPLVFALSVPALVLLRNVPHRILAARAFAAYREAIAADDLTEARRVFTQDVAPLYAKTRATTEWVRLNEGSLFTIEANFVDARRLLESIDEQVLAPGWRPFLWNNLAWALVHLGEGPRAVELARASLGASAGKNVVTTRQDFRASQLGVLGAALVVAGEPAEAIAYLEQSLARGGPPRSQAARAFFLGEAFSALGRSDDANVAYRRAVMAAPDGAHGKRAASKITHAYR